MSEYLPQEIVMMILARLPPKPLIRFRCVSKSWCSMISSPYFISMHTQHALVSPSNTNQMIVRLHGREVNNVEFTHDEGIKIEYPFRFNVRLKYKIVGSWNGLVCLVEDPLYRSDSIQLWNPAIKRKLRLPMSQTSSKECILGFGFDARNNDYKVVRICFVEEEYLCPSIRIVEVYSLSRGSWHTVEDETPRKYAVKHLCSEVFINGNLHWATYKLVGKNDMIENIISSFNVSLEKLDEIPLPEALENECTYTPRAMELGGSLAVGLYVWSESCSIWVMKKYGDVESWSLDYNVVSEVGMGIGKILGLRVNGDVLMTSRNGRLVSYSRLTGEQYVDVALFGAECSFYAGPYFESLALLAEP